MMHSKVNPLMTAMNFRETMMSHILAWGNGYAQKIRNEKNEIRELWPIPPNMVRIEKSKAGQYVYIVRVKNQDVKISRENMLHIAGLGYDGFMGYSVISKARESIGVGMAAEEFGARFFGSGTHPSVVIEHPQKLSADAHSRLSKSLDKAHGGLGRSHRLMLLEEGMKIEKLGIPPNDAQFLETRQFQVPEIARWFNLPPHKLKDLTKSSFNNIEQEQLSFVTDSILPWLIRLEQNYNMQLLYDKEVRRGYYFHHVVEGLLRGDTESRGKFYNQMFMVGAMSINEIREKEDMDPIENGNAHMVPLNMVPIDSTINAQKPIVAPQDEPQQPPEAKQSRSITGRDKILRLYKPLIARAAQTLVNFETTKIRKAINNYRKRDFAEDLAEAFKKIYESDFPEKVLRKLYPLIRDFAGAIQEEMAAEIGVEVGLSDTDEKKLKDYIERYTERHAGRSMAKLLEALEDENPIETIDELTDQWRADRADQVAQEEMVRASSFMVSMVTFGAGLKLIWKTRAQSCLYCKSLEGKTIADGEAFVNDGDKVKPVDGEGKSMKVKGLKTHPPLHRGCDCYVSAV